jgi:pyruvate,water dikinase
MSTVSLAQPAPISWRAAGDDRLSWAREPMHWPGPVLPLDADLSRLCIAGISAGLAAYGEPIRFRCQQVNTYLYLAVEPLAADEAPGPGGPERLESAVAGLPDQWEHEWLPEIRRHLAFLEEVDAGSLAGPDLAIHLDATLDRLERLWALHFTLWFPMMTAISSFEEAYSELLGADDPLEPYRLLQGFDNHTLATQRALWAAARPFLSDARVRAALEHERPADVLAGLAGSPAGRGLRGALDAYLAEHGHAGVRDFPSTRSWMEDPTPVLRALRDAARRPDRDPSAETAALAAEREAAIADARARIASRPAAAVARFERLLRSAQMGVVMSEDHSYWIDSRCMHAVRRVLLEVGRRAAAAGALPAAEDVFLLTLEELRATARAPGAVDRSPTVAARRAEMERLAEVEPPPTLGPDGGPPPDSPIGRAIGKFFGGPGPEHTAREVRGASGSPGRARGPARVLRSFSEAGRVAPGDVLVVTTTSAPWTPLFATVAAVVTDTGGVLCHAAIVAREYRVPAVVGTRTGTSVIRDGELVEVDGDAGVVRTLGPA